MKGLNGKIICKVTQLPIMTFAKKSKISHHHHARSVTTDNTDLKTTKRKQF